MYIFIYISANQCLDSSVFVLKTKCILILQTGIQSKVTIYIQEEKYWLFPRKMSRLSPIFKTFLKRITLDFPMNVGNPNVKVKQTSLTVEIGVNGVFEQSPGSEVDQFQIAAS